MEEVTTDEEVRVEGAKSHQVAVIAQRNQVPPYLTYLRMMEGVFDTWAQYSL